MGDVVIAMVLIAAQFTGLVVFGIAAVLIGIGAFKAVLEAAATVAEWLDRR